MSPSRRNLAVGVVVLVGLLALGWMILQFAGKSAEFLFTSGTPITLVTTRADGVGDGSGITFRGVDVGRVLTIRRSPDNQRILIEAVIDAKPPLPSNLRGVIERSSLLGASATIQLEIIGNEIPSPQPLAPHQQLTAEYAPDFTALASDLHQNNLVEHLNLAVLSIQKQADKIGTVLDSVQSILADPNVRQDIRATIVNAKEATESARKIARQMEGIAGRVEKVTDDAGATIAETHATVTEARATIARTGRNVDGVTHQLGDSLDRLNKVLANFESISGKMDHGNGTLALLLNDPRFYESLNDSAKELTGVIATMQRLVQQWEQEGLSLKLK